MGPPGLLENVTNLICDFLELKANEGKGVQDTTLSLPYTFQHPETPFNTANHPQAPQTPYPVPPGRALTAPKHLLDSLRGI